LTLSVYWCAFSPTLLATCSGDKAIRICNRNDFSERPFLPLSGNSYGVHCYSYILAAAVSRFLPLLSRKSDGTVALWGFHLGHKLLPMLLVTACAFSPTLPWMVTGSTDKTVNICHWQRAQQRDIKSSVFNTIVPFQAHWPEDVLARLSEESMEELVTTFTANNIDGPMSLMCFATFHSFRSSYYYEPSVGPRGKVLRKVEALKAALMGSGAPYEFLCPITREVLKDPVIAADGYSYEKETVESWISPKNAPVP
uniref:U-box domain-containing protein n=1 Tax=Oncorhynchus mykiss TaxID=8022 RepID=A0A8C7WDM7_ONCMY